MLQSQSKATLVPGSGLLIHKSGDMTYHHQHMPDSDRTSDKKTHFSETCGGMLPGPLPACPLCEWEESGFFCMRHDRGAEERHYFKCPVCALVFLLPAQRLDPAREKKRYDSHQNDPKDLRYLEFLGRLAEPLADQLRPGAAGLDFGCGPGPAMSRWFTGRGFQMEDYDPIYRSEAGLLDRVYDFITCSEAAEHFYDPRREFLLLDRLMKPGALLGVMTCRLEDENGFETWWYPNDSTHVCFFQRCTFEWIAAWRGWTVDFPGPDICVFRKPVRG